MWIYSWNRERCLGHRLLSLFGVDWGDGVSLCCLLLFGGVDVPVVVRIRWFFEAFRVGRLLSYLCLARGACFFRRGRLLSACYVLLVVWMLSSVVVGATLMGLGIASPLEAFFLICS